MACSPVTARKTENWPVTHKNSWHISAIKKSDIRKMASINTPGGYYVQGGVVTEDYYAFAVFGGDGANNYVYLAKRSSGKVVDKYSGYFGHMNSFYYKWGTKHVRVKKGSKNNDVCFDISSGKLKKINTSRCKTSRAPDYGARDLITQGNSTAGDYVYAAGWDSRCYTYGYRQKFSYARHAAAVFIYEKDSKKLKKTLYISNKIVFSEIEDVSIDGNTGDMYVLYNEDHKNGVFYQIKKSAVGLTSVSGSEEDGSGGRYSGFHGFEPVEINIAPEHEYQCASILSFWCDDADTNGEETIIKIISFVISIMTVGVVILGTIGIIWSGVLIMTARDNELQVRKAKRRISEIVIGLVIWALGATAIAFLMPQRDSSVEDALMKGAETSEEAPAEASAEAEE